MLVLSRKLDEEIIIDDDIRIKLIKVQGNRIQIGITAPLNVPIRRVDPAAAPVRAGRGESRTQRDNYSRSRCIPSSLSKK